MVSTTHHISHSLEDTRCVGQKIAALLAQISTGSSRGAIIYLQGELGSGKTTLVQTILSSIGIKGRILSPTFTVLREYSYEGKQYYHIDLYRLRDESDEIRYLLSDLAADRNSILFIEWPERLKLTINPTIRIECKMIDLKHTYVVTW